MDLRMIQEWSGERGSHGPATGLNVRREYLQGGLDLGCTRLIFGPWFGPQMTDISVIQAVIQSTGFYQLHIIWGGVDSAVVAVLFIAMIFVRWA